MMAFSPHSNNKTVAAACRPVAAAAATAVAAAALRGHAHSVPLMCVRRGPCPTASSSHTKHFLERDIGNRMRSLFSAATPSFSISEAATATVVAICESCGPQLAAATAPTTITAWRSKLHTPHTSTHSVSNETSPFSIFSVSPHTLLKVSPASSYASVALLHLSRRNAVRGGVPCLSRHAQHNYERILYSCSFRGWNRYFLTSTSSSYRSPISTRCSSSHNGSRSSSSSSDSHWSENAAATTPVSEKQDGAPHPRTGPHRETEEHMKQPQQRQQQQQQRQQQQQQQQHQQQMMREGHSTDESYRREAPSVAAAVRAATGNSGAPASSVTGTKTPAASNNTEGAESEEAASGVRDGNIKTGNRTSIVSETNAGVTPSDHPTLEEAFSALQEKYKVCLEEANALRRKAESLQDKTLRTLADMENARTRHQKELARTKDYAASDFAKAMLEVADSMAYATKALRASLPQHRDQQQQHSDHHNHQQQQEQQQQQQQQQMGGDDTSGTSIRRTSTSSSSTINNNSSTSCTVEQLQHIYEGVAMTESLLRRTLDRFGVRQFDPVGVCEECFAIAVVEYIHCMQTGEVFDPAVHEAIFEIDDPTKEKGRVAQVVQMGYKIKDRVLRAAKVGVARGGGSSTSNRKAQ